MKDFSTLQDFGKTNKQSLIDNFSVASGLPQANIEKLYENFSYDNFGDVDKINESFTKFLNPIVKFNFGNFKESIINLTEEIGSPEINEIKREMATNKLISIVSDAVGNEPNTPMLLEIVCFVLNLRNKRKMVKINESILFGSKMYSLFENDSNFKVENWNKLNATSDNLGDKENANKEDIRLYNSLKVLLSRNNNRWGYNYHIDDVYKTIVDYMNQEIEELTNADNVNSVNSFSYDEFLKSVIQDSQINIMYNNVDSLKLLIPDLQMLVYDLIVLMDYHIFSYDSRLHEYMNRDNRIDYLKSRNALLSKISSSAYSSKLHNKVNQSVFESSMERLDIDGSYMDLYSYGVKVETALQILDITKSLQNEFNLAIRKIMNIYITKTREYLFKLRDIKNKMKNIQ